MDKMDREKAIKILKECRERKLKYTFYTLDEYQTATDMAIQALEQEPCIQEKQANADKIDAVYIDGFKAGYSQSRFDLEQEPCEDAISRSDAIRIASGYCHWSNIPKELAKLPSVNPKPCDDAISRQAALDAIKQAIINHDSAIMRVCNLPPVTPAEKTGHWIHWASGDDCSECGWSTGRYIPMTRYCPNCGAKMEVEE